MMIQVDLVLQNPVNPVNPVNVFDAVTFYKIRPRTPETVFFVQLTLLQQNGIKSESSRDGLHILKEGEYVVDNPCHGHGVWWEHSGCRRGSEEWR
jgi:hypothetical protein